MKILRVLLFISVTINVLFFLLFIAYTKPGILTIEKKANAQIPIQNITPSTTNTFGIPARIIIPNISVDAAILPVGKTELGDMDVPDSILDVGWFSSGPTPGSIGSSVIAGHVNGRYGKAGVFANLRQLQPGDVIAIEDTERRTKHFAVRESREYNPNADSFEIFNNEDGAMVNLITCEGIWNPVEKTYSKRLVVFTDIIKSP
jgi:sortase A